MCICIIWFLISSLSLGVRSAHKLREDKLANNTFVVLGFTANKPLRYVRKVFGCGHLSLHGGPLPSRGNLVCGGVGLVYWGLW